MKSSFVKEQQRYTRKDLKHIFCCSDFEIIRIINKLKQFGVLKTVRNSKDQLDMSDLADEDIEINDADELSNQHLYVFTFVGIIIVEGKVLKCYPKYIFKTTSPKKQLIQIIKVLQKYNSKEQIIKMYNVGGNVNSFNRLAGIIFLLNDYFENGLYTETQNIIQTNGVGEISWDLTINNTYPMIINNNPYYIELKNKHTVCDDNNFFRRIHRCMLTECIEQLEELLEIFGFNHIKLTDEKLDNLGEIDYILYRLESEISIQFNARKQMVLKAMVALIKNKITLDDIDSFSMFGTNSFNIVWEKVCSQVLNNQLNTRISALGLDHIIIPKNANYSLNDRLISIIEKPKWQAYADDEFKNTIESDKTLLPDIVSISPQEKMNPNFIILDAKYYNIQLEPSKRLKGQPGVNDVSKQYLYQLAYNDFIKSNKFNKVKNCFLLPTEENEAISINKGSVKLDIFENLGLEKIEVRELSAETVFSYYLKNIKINIQDLKLE